MDQDIYKKHISKIKQSGYQPDFDEQYLKIKSGLSKPAGKLIPSFMLSKPFAVVLASVLLVSSCMSFDYYKSKSVDSYLYSMITPETAFFSEDIF